MGIAEAGRGLAKCASLSNAENGAICEVPVRTSAPIIALP